MNIQCFTEKTLQIQIQLENGITLPVQIPANADIGKVMQQIEVYNLKS